MRTHKAYLIILGKIILVEELIRFELYRPALDPTMLEEKGWEKKPNTLIYKSNGIDIFDVSGGKKAICGKNKATWNKFIEGLKIRR